MCNGTFSQALSSCTHISYANVLNEDRVQFAALVDLLRELVEDAIELSVLEATLACLGQGSTDGEGDNNVIGILLLTLQEEDVSTLRMTKIKTSQGVVEK